MRPIHPALSLLAQVIRHNCVPASGLPLDLSHFGLDDHMFRDNVLNAWDVTALGVPTALHLDYNALSDTGVKALVLRMREGSANGRCSLRHLSLDGNRLGIDAALLLADFIADWRGVLQTVTLFRYDCSADSPTSLAFSRPSDKFLNFEGALMVALLVDAYVGLRTLVFSLREAEGPIPDAFNGRPRLTQLAEVDLRGNHLEGPLPLCLLRAEKKSFHANRLTLPLDLHELAHVTELDWSGIGLSGILPPALAALPHLTRLDVSHNPSLTGPVPVPLLLLPHLCLHGCKLSLPESVDGLCHVTSLNLARQGLVGQLPDTWTRLSALTRLDLSHNHLEGPIPAPLLLLPFRSFTHNRLTLPTSYVTESLGHLRTLDLNNQGLCGAIPPALACLSSLTCLRLEGNRLEGPIPARLLLLPSRHFGRNRLVRTFYP